MKQLKVNKKKYYQFNLNNLIAFDTENDENANCTLVSFYDGKKFTIFKENIFEQSLNFFERNKKKYYVGLNVLYDLINILGTRNLVDNFKLFFGKTNFVFAQDDYKNNFFDLFWLMPFSLKQIGHIIGLEKLETDNFSDEKYNMRDTEITYKAAKNLISYLNKKRWDFSFTLASLALKIFRRYYQTDNFVNFPVEMTETLRAAYFGGRTENFVQGEIFDNINVYDVNSLYPFVMQNIYPNPNNYIESKEIKYFGIYEIDVEIKKDVYFPLLPLRDNKLIFPVGHFTTWATGAEILQAQKYGQIKSIKVLRGYIFSRGKRYFTRFVNDLYKLRKENKNKFENKIIKLVMNSLYGKFAQGRERTIWDGQKFTIEIEEEFPENNIIIFSIFTTAFARMHMHVFFEKIRKMGKRIYYTDTDSIHTNAILPTSNKLGALKCEGNFNYAKYLAPKFYTLDGEQGKILKAKGIPKDVQEEFLQELQATFKKPIKLKESFKRNIKANLWIEMTKQFHNLSKKRNFLENDSFPLEF